MSTTAIALDPGQAIAAAMRDLYDELRAIVDRGPTDDPGLLDEIGRLTGRIRTRITRARKKAEPTEVTVAGDKPVVGRPSNGTASVPAKVADAPTVRLPVVVPGGPRHAAQPGGRTRSAAETPADLREFLALRDRTTTPADTPTVPRHRAVSVAVPADRSTAVTIRLPQAHPVRPRQRPARLPLWIHALVILLIVGGITLGTTTSAWGFTLAPVGATGLALAHRWSVHRPASTTRGGGR
jgi:hypothetical protein